jgi:hypothetical protein
MATFLMAQRQPPPELSHEYRGDVSHRPKGGQLSRMACFSWFNGANSHESQSDIMLTDVAKAD